MAERYSSPFDALLDAGREQFDALTGGVAARGNETTTAQRHELPIERLADQGQRDRAAGCNDQRMITGTCRGVLFQLRTRSP